MSDRTLTDTPLGDAHAALHAALEDALYRVLTRLLEGDLAGAQRALVGVDAIMAEHQAFEEAHVLPRYARVAPADGPGRADHVAGDHVVLARNLAAAHDALAELTTGGASRVVLEKLPALQRVIATLEHHTLREARVYASLTDADLIARAQAHIDTLTAKMRALS